MELYQKINKYLIYISFRSLERPDRKRRKPKACCILQIQIKFPHGGNGV